jgi:hypothetical protein
MIEIKTFRLRSAVDDASFRALDERWRQEFVYQQLGAARQTTALSGDGTWVHLTVWETAEHADAAQRASAADAAAMALEAALDADSVEVRRFVTL